MPCPSSVSYTHLDVYKRQAWDGAPFAMVSVTIRVTAKLIPEVETVIANIKTDITSWYNPIPAVPILEDK